MRRGPGGRTLPITSLDENCRGDGASTHPSGASPRADAGEGRRPRARARRADDPGSRQQLPPSSALGERGARAGLHPEAIHFALRSVRHWLAKPSPTREKVLNGSRDPRRKANAPDSARGCGRGPVRGPAPRALSRTARKHGLTRDAEALHRALPRPQTARPDGVFDAARDRPRTDALRGDTGAWRGSAATPRSAALSECGLRCMLHGGDRHTAPKEHEA